MKFKIIFLLFNVLIVFSFLMIFFLPIFMLGGDYAAQFLHDSWYIALIFAVILIFINIIYFMNRKVLHYLETENWKELKLLLEQKIFRENKYSKINIRMYISTCIATSALDDITVLENKLRKEKPAVIRNWALQLGLPYLLNNDAAKMKDYFGEFLDADIADSGWIKWNYCFALLLRKETAEAVELLKKISAAGDDPLLRLSSLYMLSPFKSDQEVETLLDDGRAELRGSMTRDGFFRDLDKRKDNVQMLFLAKIFDEAIDWLYREEEQDTQ